MSRYTGPRLRRMRALGRELPGLSRKSIERRPYRPGQHGQARRRKISDYGLRLIEKQSLRTNYGVTERQLRNLMAEALRTKENSGEKLLELLERRLDNVVWRAGFAPTIPAARQLVTHGHVHVNGRRVTFPGYRVSAEEAIGVRQKSWKLLRVLDALAEGARTRPPWLAFDEDAMSVTMTTLPDPHAVPFPVDVRLVVEFYAATL
jgi:small subunit ribosomal protein S4